MIQRSNSIQFNSIQFNSIQSNMLNESGLRQEDRSGSEFVANQSAAKSPQNPFIAAFKIDLPTQHKGT